MGKMKSLIILFLTYFSIACGFFVPAGLLKLSCQDNAYIIDGIVDKSEGMSTHTGNIHTRSLNTQLTEKLANDLKSKKDSINDLVLKDVTPGQSNVNERSFVYLKQKHRTPIINVVHGAHDGLGKSHQKGLDDYNQEFIKKPFQSYIEKFLKESSFFNQISNAVIDTKSKHNKLHANQIYPGSARKDSGNDLDKNIYDKLKIVELLKAPLLRCEHKNENRRSELYTDRNGYQPPYGNNNGIAYPVHPTRHYQHFPVNNNQRVNSYGRPEEKETLCSHIYQSHVKDCVHRMFGKDANENTLKVLTKCIKEMK
ncbi:uncharacterized protein LOC128677211 [Plodia interpunctella]|uniref:uncharacterized protein LOC128677211 n=1 Tax=Plodia interpunctella TaxID=58824 RepID=UPI00236885FC|nr:uncharacterized protein LOC128677211 [Plodia interpunctella]